MPYSEPNSFGEMTADEWRATYEQYVREFKDSRFSGTTNVTSLRIRLQKLGYAGTRLNEEIQHIKSL